MKKIFVLCMMCCLSTIMLADLSQMEKPWKTPHKRMSLRDYIGNLYYWADKHGDNFKLSKVTETPKGLPFYAIEITDTTVPNENKNVILLTAFHGGGERTATAGVMAFLDWLMSDDPLAKESLKKNILIVTPNNNPEGYFLDEAPWNSRRIDPYSMGRGNRMNLKDLSILKPEDGPEYIAYCKLVDKYKPDFHMDIHGTAMHYNGQIQRASIGRAASNSSLDIWDKELLIKLLDSAKKQRFGVIDFSMHDERLIWGPAMTDAWKSFCNMGQPYTYAAMYGSFREHTMICTIESTWNFTVVEPMKELLRQANKGFSKNRVNDFKVNTIQGLIVTHGETKADRRENRSKLWKKQDFFSSAFSYPDVSNYIVNMAIYGREDFKKFAGEKPNGMITFDTILKQTENSPYFNHENPKKFFAVAPPTVKKVWGNMINLKADVAEPELKEGFGIITKIQVENAKIVDLKLNGFPIEESTTDGYEIWSEDGFTFVRVNIPAEKVMKNKSYIVTCAWNSPEGRDLNDDYGYLPDSEVKEFINNNLSEKARQDIEKAEAVRTKHFEDKKKNK